MRIIRTLAKDVNKSSFVSASRSSSLKLLLLLVLLQDASGSGVLQRQLGATLFKALHTCPQ